MCRVGLLCTARPWAPGYWIKAKHAHLVQDRELHSAPVSSCLQGHRDIQAGVQSALALSTWSHLGRQPEATLLSQPKGDCPQLSCTGSFPRSLQQVRPVRSKTGSPEAGLARF